VIGSAWRGTRAARSAVNVILETDASGSTLVGSGLGPPNATSPATTIRVRPEANNFNVDIDHIAFSFPGVQHGPYSCSGFRRTKREVAVCAPLGNAEYREHTLLFKQPCLGPAVPFPAKVWSPIRRLDSFLPWKRSLRLIRTASVSVLPCIWFLVTQCFSL